MAYALPSIPDFKGQFVRDFPYAVPVAGGGSGAAIELTIGAAGGGIAAAAVSAPGSGYPANVVPTALVIGGKGVGAILQPTIVGGALTAVAIVNAGVGYTEVPSVYISNGLGDNTDLAKVTDYDIANAQAKATAFNITSRLTGSQLAFTQLYNLLAAHYLCETLQAAGTGLGGQATWLTKAKTVGNVMETFDIPARILNSPYLSKLSKTTYGAQFLELVSPQLIANFQVFHGWTLP